MSEEKPFTALVREIALEVDCVGQNEEGDDIFMSKGEQLVRQMYAMALGSKPDRAVIKELYERMEGKVPTSSAKDAGGRAKVADRVGEQTKRRMNKLAAGDDGDRPRDTETPTERAVSGPESILEMFKNRPHRTEDGDGERQV